MNGSVLYLKQVAMHDLPTFFWDFDNFPSEGELFELKGQEAKHGIRVLRLRPGNQIRLINGKGFVAICQIVSIENNKLILKTVHQYQTPSDLCSVILGASLIKSDKMDLIIKKCTEIGVQEIFPIYSTYSIVKMDAKKAKKRLQRWQEIAKQSLKQCKGTYLTQINMPLPFSDFLELSNGLQGAKIILWEQEENSSWLYKAWSQQGKKRPVTLLIGPEGGFSKTEIQKASENGFMPASLGKRIYRAETAAIGTSFLFRQWLDNLDTDSGA